MDFAGPIYIRHGARRHHGIVKKKAVQELKTYILLYTCALTRALHLELVPDTSVPSFTMATRRFFSRKATAQVIYSDNARTFQRADKYFKALYNSTTLADFLAGRRIKWKYSASLSQWWGGWWERMVRTMKSMLKKTLRRTVLTYEELETILTEVEAAVNSRPLAYVTEREENLPITPSRAIGRLTDSIIHTP